MSEREQQISAIVRETLRQNEALLADQAKAIVAIERLCAELDAEQNRGRKNRNVARRIWRDCNVKNVLRLDVENPWLNEDDE